MCDSEDEAERFRCETLATGNGGARVLLSTEAGKEFWALEMRQKARLVSNMELWADGRQMTDKQLNRNEGRTKGGIDRMLQAFKVHKVRCYGFVAPLEGRKTFIVVDVDPAKKSDKGKVRVLDRAKARVNSFEKEYGDFYE